MPSTSSAPPSSPTSRRAGVDRDQIVAKALDLVASEDAAALTMRRLAAELDVTTTTLYWHVGNRDELIAEVVRLQSERQAAKPIRGRSPRTRVMAAARHIWEAALDNRAITSLAHQSGTTSILELPLQQALLRELNAAGLQGRAAVDALRAIVATVAGFLVQALRDESAIAPQWRRSALWAAADTGDLDPAAVAALAQPTDLSRLFESTVQAVVALHVPESGAP